VLLLMLDSLFSFGLYSKAYAARSLTEPSYRLMHIKIQALKLKNKQEDDPRRGTGYLTQFSPLSLS
jgi:hypothetical protein